MKKEIPLTVCGSSRIHAHGHCSESNRLRLQFYKKGENGELVPGAIYEYAGITKAVYGDLCKAESVGRFFGQVISAKDDAGNLIYPFTRIEAEPVAETASQPADDVQ